MWLYQNTLSFLTGSPLLGLLLLFVILLTTYSYLSRSPWKRLPPGPPSFPVIGSLPFLVGDGRKVFSKMAAKYGDVFTVYVGSTRMIVLNKYDVIKEALLKTPRIFDVRSDMFKDITNGKGKTVVYSCITLKHPDECFRLSMRRSLWEGCHINKYIDVPIPDFIGAIIPTITSLHIILNAPHAALNTILNSPFYCITSHLKFRLKLPYTPSTFPSYCPKHHIRLCLLLPYKPS